MVPGFASVPNNEGKAVLFGTSPGGVVGQTRPMIAMRTADVTARVVAWHNRHPLARRIVPDEVHGIGVVVLPFALKPRPEAEAADGLTALAPPTDLTPIFGDDWMFHAAPQRLGAWVRRHGVYPLAGCSHWPLRQIDADIPLAHAADAQGLNGRTARHVITAVVDSGGQRVRVLLAPGPSLRSAAVFGQRLFSLPRMSSLAGAGATLGLAMGVAMWWGSGSTGGPDVPADAATVAAVEGVAPASASAPAGDLGTSVAQVAQAAQVAQVAQVASAPIPDESPPSAASAEPVALDMPPAAPTPSAPVVVTAPEPPFDADPVERLRSDGAPPLVHIRPQLTEDERRDARVQAVALRPATAASASAIPNGTVFAIATPPMRKRDDALAQQVLLQSLRVQTATPVPTQLDVMAVQGRWRVVWWPHTRQQDAEALLLQARARGLKVELIAF